MMFRSLKFTSTPAAPKFQKSTFNVAATPKMTPRFYTSPATSAGSAAQQISKLKIGKLNHVAIAVSNLEEASALYRDVMGANVSKPVVR
jgi:hypothetical protein